MENLQNKVKELEDKLLKYELQTEGIYAPKHILNCRSEFTKAIKTNLKEQKNSGKVKEMFSVENDISRMGVETFNFKCSDIVRGLDGYNLKSAKLKVQEYANDLIHLCNRNRIKILNYRLFELKAEQLELETDYIIFQANEKFKKKEQARMVREQQKVDREWFDTLKQLEEKYDECVHTNDYSNVSRLDAQIEQAKKMLRERKAGWVYVISNDDMKEGMCKIGVTRRVSPIVRINELSNASHAFKFKIHAIIYSDDCFGLETKLHRRFAEYRVNPDNYHKEFFYVSLDELQKVLKEEFDIDVDMQENIYDDNEALTDFYSFNFNEEDI